MKSVMVKTAAVLGLGFLLAFSACTNPGPTIPDYPIPDSNIEIWAYAYPLASVSSGSTPYAVYVQFTDKRPAATANAFNDAIVTANGLTVPLSTMQNNYFWIYTGLTLAAGDTVSLKIMHALIGTVTASVTVPTGVPDNGGNINFTLTPALPASNVAISPGNTNNSYVMTWITNGSTEYFPVVRRYDSSKASKGGYGSHTTTSPFTFQTSWVLDSSSVPYPFLSFSLAALAKTPLTGFAAASALRAESPYQPSLSNK